MSTDAPSFTDYPLRNVRLDTLIRLRWLAVINVLLGAFNLLPASPLDGGKVLHGLLWLVTKNRWLATRLAAGAGLVLGAACSLIGLLAFEENLTQDGWRERMTGFKGAT